MSAFLATSGACLSRFLHRIALSYAFLRDWGPLIALLHFHVAVQGENGNKEVAAESRRRAIDQGRVLTARPKCTTDEKGKPKNTGLGVLFGPEGPTGAMP